MEALINNILKNWAFKKTICQHFSYFMMVSGKKLIGRSACFLFINGLQDARISFFKI